MQLALDGTGLNAIDYRALPRSSKNHERNKAKHNIGARNQLGKWPGAPTQHLQTLQTGASLEKSDPNRVGVRQQRQNMPARVERRSQKRD
jgi:hypothetical protein